MKATFKVKLNLTPAQNITDAQVEFFLKELRQELMSRTADAVNSKKPLLIQTSRVEVMPAKTKSD